MTMEDKTPQKVFDLAEKSVGDSPMTINTQSQVDPTILEEARRATAREHRMTLRESLKIYPWAIAWSVFISLGVVMEAYDGGLLGSFYALPAFQKKFGNRLPNGKYNISASWQSALGQGQHVGQFFGLFFSGWASERFGYKKTMLGGYIAIAGLVFMQFFATNVQVLLASEILIGFPLGIFLALTTVYAAEVCPVVLRSYLTTYVNLCWNIGKFVSTGVLRSQVTNESEWAYRIPFAIQWCWIPILFIGTVLAPESPWWLVRVNRLPEAKKVLRRLKSIDNDANLDEDLSLIVVSIEHERQVNTGASYLDCFKGVNLRRTEIACMAWMTQPMVGYSLGGSATYFFEQAGLSAVYSFDLSLGGNSLAFLCGIVTWWFIGRFGRRQLYVWGVGLLFFTQLAIGILGIPPRSSGVAWATGGMTYVFTIVYDLTIGSSCYAIISETPASQLRTKTAGLARNAYNIFTIINNILTTYQINATAWDWRGKAGFFWAGSCAIFWVWCFFRLPETKGRTFGELDILFENHIPARKFAQTEVNQAEAIEEEMSVF